MKRAIKKLSAGFSLIEMMVVLGIMGILLAVGVASYNSINERSKVEQAARNLVTQLRDWQKQVDSGIGSELCGTDAFLGRSVTVSGNQFQSVRSCSGVHPDGEPLTYDLLNGTQVANFATFTFLPLGKGVTVNPGTSEQFEITNSSLTIQYRITVSNGGGINVQKL